MDGELVNNSPSDDLGGGSNHSPYTYAQRFHELFPSYLAMGMTPEQYWDGDPMMAKDYRRAEEIRNEKRNEELWLQGMYFYDALLCVAPVLQAFAKKGTKARPYTDKPYALTAKERNKEKEDKVKATYSKGMRYMEAITSKNNKRFAKANDKSSSERK